MGRVETRVAAAQDPPRYERLMIDWVYSAVGGQDPPGVESPNLFAVSQEEIPATWLAWYGRAAVQLSGIAFFALVFGFTAIALPIAIVRRARRRSSPARTGPRLAAAAGWLIGVVNLVLLAGFVVALVRFMMVDEGALKVYLEQPVLQVALLVPHVGAMALLIEATWAWWHRYWGVLARVHYTLLTVAAWAFVPFLAYWHLLGP